MATRRELIGMTLAGAGALAARHVLGNNPQLAGLAADDPWDAVRAGFDFAAAAAPKIPMNAANLAPAWRAVRARVAAAAAQLDADPSFHHRDLFLGIERTRAKRLLAASLGIESADDVALVRNTTEANSIIVNGLDLRADDEVVVWDQNHHSNYRSWAYRQQRSPFVLRGVRLAQDTRSEADIVAAFVAQLSARTRVVAFSEISNITGLRLPTAALCRAIRARAPDAFIHVDGAQSWGATALNLHDAGCDAYAASAHKWLCGPRELGILYVRRAAVGRLWPATLGYDFAFDYPEQRLPDTALRFESLGQRHDAAVAGLVTALEHHAALGAERVEQRIAWLADQLRSRLDAAGVRTRAAASPALRHGIVVVEPQGANEAFGGFRRLYEGHGVSAAFVHHSRVIGGAEPIDPGAERLRLRLCPHIYNNSDDIDRVVAALSGRRA